MRQVQTEGRGFRIILKASAPKLMTWEWSSESWDSEQRLVTSQWSGASWAQCPIDAWQQPAGWIHFNEGSSGSTGPLAVDTTSGCQLPVQPQSANLSPPASPTPTASVAQPGIAYPHIFPNPPESKKGPYKEQDLERWSSRLMTVVRHYEPRCDREKAGSPMSLKTVEASLYRPVPEDAIPDCVLFYSPRLYWTREVTVQGSTVNVQWKLCATRPRREARRVESRRWSVTETV